eukprot:8224393-Heterocapsa_arctica.AAC.1
MLPRDFKFAFTSAEEAAEACPEAAAQCAAAWRVLSLADVEVDTAWELWTKFRRSSLAPRVLAPPATKRTLWTGLRKRKA